MGLLEKVVLLSINILNFNDSYLIYFETVVILTKFYLLEKILEAKI